ncbi:hypothetical protein TREES_T100016148 [Tupaia chinensis]|uniref:Ig-like domain-containing protein n=1 Tax=Tupaia chinensis TaxID=246437 RepID=L9KAN0_TUPCH|nr:hypothetical protein TREES_T100016148 [Tupaia chinensis]
MTEQNSPTWVGLWDKYGQRVQVPNVTSLRIENLTSEDSGQYQAQVTLRGGKRFDQIFLLTVVDVDLQEDHRDDHNNIHYADLMKPESREDKNKILTKPPSITSDWCNVTLTCRTPGATENLMVTWESKGIPRELEQRGTPGPVPNPWTLALRLPLSQRNASLTCVVSNDVDQKSDTSDLGNICAKYVDLLEDHRDDHNNIHYADLMEPESREDKNKLLQEPSVLQSQAVSEQHLEEEESFTTEYSEIHKPGQAMKIF